MVVSDLITATFKLIGSIAKTEVPDADEMADAFSRLKDMIDSWGAERQMMHRLTISTFSLVSGQQTYTIGAGGNFNIARPMFIQDAGLVNTAYTPNFELPMRILTIDEWASLTIKSQTATQSWYLWYDYADATGLGNINIWPIPSVSTLQIALYIPTAISNFTAITDTIVLPPGYAECLRYNLAVRLCPEWGRPIDPVVAALAQETLARVQRANKRLDTLGVDDALIGGSDRGIFNYLTGQSTGMRNT